MKRKKSIFFYLLFLVGGSFKISTVSKDWSINDFGHSIFSGLISDFFKQTTAPVLDTVFFASWKSNWKNKHNNSKLNSFLNKCYVPKGYIDTKKLVSFDITTKIANELNDQKGAYVFGGKNGSGKTSAVYKIAETTGSDLIFINASLLTSILNKAENRSYIFKFIEEFIKKIANKESTLNLIVAFDEYAYITYDSSETKISSYSNTVGEFTSFIEKLRAINPEKVTVISTTTKKSNEVEDSLKGEDRLGRYINFSTLSENDIKKMLQKKPLCSKIIDFLEKDKGKKINEESFFDCMGSFLYNQKIFASEVTEKLKDFHLFLKNKDESSQQECQEYKGLLEKILKKESDSQIKE